MIIRSVEMENFRGFSSKKINFEDRAVVLLAAANGFGKTTTVDAIEWCLTGNIGRLRASFDIRSTNNDERNMNKDGILKYSAADSNKKVKVTICLYNGIREMILCREQKNDYLDPEMSMVTLDGDEDAAATFIKEYVGESFYNYHFCDVQKSFNIQSTKREKLQDYFKEFITDYEEYRNIACTIELFAKDTERYIEDKKGQKISQETLDSLDSQIESLSSEKKIQYPAAIFYSGENTEVEELNREELIAQKDNVEMCGYSTARDALTRLVQQEELIKQQVILSDILSDWKTKAESIEKAKTIGLFDSEKDILGSCQNYSNKLKRLSLSKDTILKTALNIIDLGVPEFSESDFDKITNEIKDDENKCIGLSKDIEVLDGNNSILKLLSNMNSEKSAMIAYRKKQLCENGVARCPVCGSETFSSMKEEEILKEAANYIAKNNEVLQMKVNEKKAVDDKIDLLKEQLLKQVKFAVGKEQERLEKEIAELTELKNQMEPYFTNVRKLMNIRKEISSVDAVNAELVKNLLEDIDKKLLSVDEEKKVTDTYQEILTVLGYSYDEEKVKQTLASLEPMVKQTFEVVDFSYSLFVEKLNALKGLLANRQMLDIKEKKASALEKNQKLNREIVELEELRNNAAERAEEIHKVVDELSMEEYEKVGPVLKKYYDKLSRFNVGDSFNLKHEKDGISLVDDKGKSIVNILSNGQITVFMLAYFFAGISSRSNREKMKIYFIDDLTACMDDVNMLAFLDIIKYQMDSKATIDQLFFATCDDRISGLLEYKMEGRGIKTRIITEEEFVS